MDYYFGLKLDRNFCIKYFLFIYIFYSNRKVKYVIGEIKVIYLG